MAPARVKDYISVSELQMAQRCLVQHDFRYRQGLYMAPGIAQIRGTGFHAGVSRNFTQKVRSYVDLPKDEVLAATAEAVDGEFQKEVHFTPAERTVGVARLRDQTKDVAVRMANFYHDKVAPWVQPEMVERKITFSPDPDKYPFKMMGVLDLVKRVGATRVIEDLKTTSKSPDSTAATKSQQLTMYSLLYRALTGEEETAVALSHIVISEAGDVKHVHQIGSRDLEDIQIFVRRLAAAHRIIQAGVVLPTNPENWWCSEKWCGYWAICPYVRNGRRTE